MNITIINDTFLKTYPETAYTAMFWIGDDTEWVNLVCDLGRPILPYEPYYKRFLLKRNQHFTSPRYQAIEQAIIDWMVNH